MLSDNHNARTMSVCVCHQTINRFHHVHIILSWLPWRHRPWTMVIRHRSNALRSWEEALARLSPYVHILSLDTQTHISCFVFRLVAVDVMFYKSVSVSVRGEQRTEQRQSLTKQLLRNILTVVTIYCKGIKVQNVLYISGDVLLSCLFATIYIHHDLLSSWP